ncbi:MULTISPECIES: ATP-binding protein [unclassified Flavobacterium]|jgi:predicted AAA+ superfamily ATPase|uniref:ATP-binding protein n=1 Tax=unclassified Flavobacterium TaxID=196869 RepID=UPI0025C45E7D|nr:MULTISPECIES: ATP-binding protein [unclassified Flavobacterium]
MNANRALKTAMDVYKKKYPILALTGPRQSGKTTFLKTQFQEYEYVNLENLDTRNFAIEDPNAFLKQYNKYVIFDEVQRVPHLFSYLQTKVDEDKIMGQYILSGSQNFHLMQNITQSLAGRVALFKLLPFDISEMQAANWLSDDYAINLQKGFYPAIYDREIPSKVFYSNYIQTYVERDLSELIHVKDLKQFRNFISLCAARVGQLVNLNSLANECGISQPTAKSWISVLENSYIVYQLQPYFSNFNKRVTKSSKLYFYDTGLLCNLLKLNDADSVRLSSLKGSLFENYVINEYVKKNYHNNLLRDLWFWRDAVGHEVDLIWQKSELLNLVEIKASETIKSEMFKGLNYFEKLKPELIESKSVVHTGLFNQERTIGKVLSWKDFIL